MADGFWNRQQPPLQQHSPGMLKRPRSDYDFPSAGVPSTHGMLGYLPRDDDRGVPVGIKDTQSLGSAYDRYLQSGQLSFSSGDASYNFGAGDRSGRGLGGFPGLPPLGELSMMGGPRGVGLDVGANGRVSSAGQFPVDPLARPGRDVLPLPRDASNTIFVEGLPADSTKREVAHIFRPFLGYKEVRLVTKESKHRGGDPLILCFVDFESPACAATALNALQGYRMDDHESDSHILRLQFARFPGARSGSGREPRSGSGHRVTSSIGSSAMGRYWYTYYSDVDDLCYLDCHVGEPLPTHALHDDDTVMEGYSLSSSAIDDYAGVVDVPPDMDQSLFAF